MSRYHNPIQMAAKKRPRKSESVEKTIKDAGQIDSNGVEERPPLDGDLVIGDSYDVAESDDDESLAESSGRFDVFHDHFEAHSITDAQHKSLGATRPISHRVSLAGGVPGEYQVRTDNYMNVYDDEALRIDRHIAVHPVAARHLKWNKHRTDTADALGAGLCRYADVYCARLTPAVNASVERLLMCHALNHVLKTRQRILKVSHTCSCDALLPFAEQ